MIKVIMMMAMTADGLIAKHERHLPTEWTSPADKKLFQKISKKAGAVIMGDKTFFTFPAPLPGRLNVVFTLEKNPAPRPGVLWVSGEPKKVLDRLAKMGFKQVILGGGATINSLFLDAGLVAEVYLTIEPKIFGRGLSLFARPRDCSLSLISSRKLSKSTLFLKYRVLPEKKSYAQAKKTDQKS